MRKIGKIALTLGLIAPLIQGATTTMTNCPGLPTTGTPLQPYDPIAYQKWLKDNGGNPLGQWVVGNGGDNIRVNLANAREHASLMVAKVSPNLLREQDADIREFLEHHRDAYAADILASKHIWYQEEKSSCAWTTMPESSPEPRPIEFSYGACKRTLKSHTDAVALLLHEGAHHFFKDEDFADRIAIAIIKAWRSGDLEWQSTEIHDAPSPRLQHSAVLAGDGQMIIFGGRQGYSVFNDGAIYNIKENTWQAISSEGAPRRYNHHAFYTGDEMIIWGGYTMDSNGGVNWAHSGAIYHIATQKWRAIKAPYTKPTGFHLDFIQAQAAVWTGSEMVVWGGTTKEGANLGGIYNPKTDEWRTIEGRGAPQRVGGHTAVFTGQGVLIWGGYSGPDVNGRFLVDTGAYYDLEKSTWKEMSTVDAPAARYGQAAVWTGNRLIIISGDPLKENRGNTLLHATGGVYNPETDDWTPFSSEMLTERQGHTAVWNGSEVLIMGGKSRYYRSYYSQVVALDPESFSWRGVSGKQAPSLRWQHSAVWNGTSMVVWGGGIGYEEGQNTGGLFFN